MSAASTSRRIIVSEVIQTSSMDCGVAAAKAILGGYGIEVSYGRLREACQTDVDGTSIDAIEELLNHLGVAANQIIIPADHVLLPAAGTFPNIAVVRLPSGHTHFIVLWRNHGRIVQVMDPAKGRSWRPASRVVRELHIHRTQLPIDQWRAWATTDEFLVPLRARLQALGIGGDQRVDAALRGDAALDLAQLDAATRLVTRLCAARGLSRGDAADRLLTTLVSTPAHASKDGLGSIPDRHWFARRAPADGLMIVTGAVLVRVRRRDTPASEARLAPAFAAMTVPESRPAPELRRLARVDGRPARLTFLLLIALAGVGVIAEALLLRSLLRIGSDLELPEQRVAIVAGMTAFFAAMCAVDAVAAIGALRFGRRFETRLRIDFLKKIPRVGDRFLQSRLASDMADRAHSVHRLRRLPIMIGYALRLATELAATAAGIIWLDPSQWRAVAVVVVVALVLPYVAQKVLIERDLRTRSLAAALSRFYLDALRGLVAVRAHGAERAVGREHEGLLVEWMRSARSLQRASLLLEALQGLVGVALGVWLVFGYASRWSDVGVVLLLVFWALNLPLLGQELALLARQYPQHRNVMLRLLEVLTAPEEERRTEVTSDQDPEPVRSGGARIVISDARVQVGGQTVLDGISASIEPGTHVGVVGRSGAGKSSLVGLLLGWYTPAAGSISVDGRPLEGETLRMLRRDTAWLDPGVELWNDTLLANLSYGAGSNVQALIERVIADADLHTVLRTLPDGLQTPIGENGGLLSGGEGQRVRLGRAMTRTNARLVIFDEAFRGLPRAQRRALLARARTIWSAATLLCVTHDVGDTFELDRVIVVEGGRIVEDGAPRDLATRPDSRYRQLLDAERSLHETIWANPLWRRTLLAEGKLIPAEPMGSQR